MTASLSWFSVQPDLHLYDIERIEVLSGPQGTTFGAGSMTGAIRYITHKPDVNSVSAGVDFNAGQIQNGQQNWTYEGFVNLPLIEGVLGFRALRLQRLARRLHRQPAHRRAPG